MSAAVPINPYGLDRKVVAEKVGLAGRYVHRLAAHELAHEIRNPLTAVKMLFQLLVDSHKIAADSRADVEIIQKQIGLIESIVDGHLRAARGEVERAEMRSLDLNAIVSDTLLLFASTAKQGGRLSLEQSEGSLPVFGDETQLAQVVYNLALNAIQAVAGAGRVSVRTGRTTSGLDGAPAVFVEVADDGPGLPEGVRDRLFQPFVSTKAAGMGLGLSIVRRIVEAHAGSLSIESPRTDSGRGTRVTVHLPELIEYHV